MELTRGAYTCGSDSCLWFKGHQAVVYALPLTLYVEHQSMITGVDRNDRVSLVWKWCRAHNAARLCLGHLASPVCIYSWCATRHSSTSQPDLLRSAWIMPCTCCLMRCMLIKYDLLVCLRQTVYVFVMMTAVNGSIDGFMPGACLLCAHVTQSHDGPTVVCCLLGINLMPSI
jgi:hypothetical protein